MRNMNRGVFQSIFADEIRNYLDMKVHLGFKEGSYYYQLKEFDQYCSARGLVKPVLLREDTELLSKRDTGEGDRGYYNRINVTKNFLIFLSLKGYDIFATRDIQYKASDFKPHIYTDDEVKRYFAAIDSYESHKAHKNAVKFPVLFRLFYCCGTRLNETLCICLNARRR